ncbi:hypothetical protein MTW86_01545 [Mammaliicoccus sciuri]|uniref:hypothetical protein n=1 Tax=Mammaliicoccus sciuri TaxID=1296 RepID=UPI001FB4E2E9|nr:hypothetical protein [Mammaliicoccus sciuri]MCJ0913262.1 hypothetical protein [Mammaliicoccus sciuri]
MESRIEEINKLSNLEELTGYLVASFVSATRVLGHERNIPLHEDREVIETLITKYKELTSKDNAVIIGNCMYVCKKSTALEEKDLVYYIYPTHVISSSEGLPTFKHVTEKGHLLDDEFLKEHFTKLD